MFSQYIDQVDSHVSALLDADCTDVRAAITKAEKKEPLALEDLAALLKATSAADKARIQSVAETVTREIHGTRIGLIAPLYIDNGCMNACRYCGMSRTNRLLHRERITSLEQFSEEARLLHDLGYHTVELVAGGVPLDIQDVNKYIELLETYRIENVAFFFDTQSSAEYHSLSEAHPEITMVHWQETYLRDQYVKFHPADTPKGDYARRLNAIETALTSGVRKYAIGVLFGLADPRKDLLLCIAHGRYLHDATGVRPTALGLVRLQPTSGAEIISMPYPVDENFHLFLAAVLRLAFPEADMIATSREKPSHIRSLLRCAATFTNATCTTVPGGYARHVRMGLQTDGQFYHESPTYPAVKRMIQGLGLTLDPTKPL